MNRATVARKNTDEDTDKDMKVKILSTCISAFAVILAAWISISAGIFNRPSAPTVVPPAALESELSKANISLTETTGKESLVRQWLRDDPQYQTMAQTILSTLAGKRVINTIPLDVITSKYRVALGGNVDTNFPPDQYKDVEKTKTAIFDTWKERHPNFSQMSFDEIIETVK